MFDIEQRGVGCREIVAAEIVLACQRVVDDREPLLDLFAALRLDLFVVGRGRREAFGAEQPYRAAGIARPRGN